LAHLFIRICCIMFKRCEGDVQA